MHAYKFVTLLQEPGSRSHRSAECRPGRGERLDRSREGYIPFGGDESCVMQVVVCADAGVVVVSLLSGRGGKQPKAV